MNRHDDDPISLLFGPLAPLPVHEEETRFWRAMTIGMWGAYIALTIYLLHSPFTH